ncbi:hypothetical protein, partial [Gemmiger sp.]|uniref:hypothetical protein n=1 Tax=Gemmiger sp. TaxID=2049027 RepID=UPI002A7F9915
AQPLIKCAASSGSRASNARPYMRNPAKQRPAWGDVSSAFIHFAQKLSAAFCHFDELQNRC